MRDRRSPGPLLARAAALVAAGALCGAALHAARPVGFRPSTFAPEVACDGEPAAAAPTEVAPAEAAALCGHPGVVIADARPAARYAEGHVAGAVHLPCDASGPLAEGALGRLAGARTVVVYGQTTAE